MEDVQEIGRQLLLEIQTCEDEERYRKYRDQLYELGSDIIPLLRDELKSVHYRRRMAASTNLGRLGDMHSVVPLSKMLNDPQSGVREMALFALGILGDASVTDAIVNALSDYDADVRYRALVALNDLGYANIEDVLIRCMKDDSYGVREQSLSQLRKKGSPDCIVAVLRALLERELDMQKMAEEALDRLVPKMTREHYKKVQEQLSPRERRLILNYIESRNLQEVYVTLWQRLQLVTKAQTAQRGLDKYGRLLNSEDERKFLQHAYGRNDSVEMLLEHFTDPDATRSILMVGDAGVGKTAVIHEFALRLMEQEEQSWQILETNTSELISGTRYLGDWETKLKEMAEAILKQKNVILYITNPDDLLGAGAHSKSDENFADFFKPYLQRGQLRMIAECSEDDIKNGLSRDPGFLRQFRQIKIQPMDDAQTLDVLERRIHDLKASHQRTVEAEDGCLARVVDYARSFYTRAGAPGRACDLLDSLVDYTSRKTDKTKDSVTLTIEMIPPCLSETTGISLDLLDDTVPLNLDATAHWFKSRLINQDHAVDTIIDRFAMIKTGLVNQDKPLGVYFLVGPTGVGKTHFAKLVAERLFGDAKRMVRFDLSEYRGRFAVEKLIGTPHDKDREGLLTEAVRNQPFSVLLFDEFEKADSEIYNLFLQILDEGRLTDAGGQTTDFRQTIIFLTSNLGASRTNISPLGFGFSDVDERRRVFSGHVQNKLDEFFAPEFLNRLDDVVVFAPLSRQAMGRLVQLELDRALERRGFGRHNITVHTEQSALEWLEHHGFSERFGARELKRVIEREILTPIGRLLVSVHGINQNRTIRVLSRNDTLSVTFDDAGPQHPQNHLLNRQGKGLKILSYQTQIKALESFCQKHQLPWSQSAAQNYDGYLSLLLSFNRSMNLIGPMDADRVLHELFMDSLVAAMATDFDNKRVLDVGTGAGLPGVVLAILFESASFTLVEPRKKRAMFLRIASQRLGLSDRITVHEARIEAVEGQLFDRVISKAFAPPKQWLEIAKPWLDHHGQIICMTRAQEKSGLETHAQSLNLALCDQASLLLNPINEDRVTYVFRGMD